MEQNVAQAGDKGLLLYEYAMTGRVLTVKIRCDLQN
jgi:hypothetical protein